MRRIIYYVATSVDGYISGPDDDISRFAHSQAADQYLKDLQDFDTVIMGRKTYEFGYKYGLKPGQPAYPHMMHYIFSKTLTFKDSHPKVKVVDNDLSLIKDLKKENGTDIYLCGGGEFAGYLLDHQLIDVLKIKHNPIILGDGVRLFGSSKSDLQLKLTGCQNYDDGVNIMTYDIEY